MNIFSLKSIAGSLLSGTARTVWGTAKIVGKSQLAGKQSTRLWNTAKMMGIGSAAGAALGYLSSDNADPTQRINSALWGGLTGAFGVAGVSAARELGAFAVKRLTARRIGRFIGRTASSTYVSGGKALSAGLSIGSFVARHPVALTAAGVGLYGTGRAFGILGERSPTLQGEGVDPRYNPRSVPPESPSILKSLTANNVSDAYFNYTRSGRVLRGSLQDSTDGLVSGLHRGRHG